MRRDSFEAFSFRHNTVNVREVALTRGLNILTILEFEGL